MGGARACSFPFTNFGGLIANTTQKKSVPTSTARSGPTTKSVVYCKRHAGHFLGSTACPMVTACTYAA
jgi:hypothetical protein